MPDLRSQFLNYTEWKVMKIIWQLESCAASDVYKPLGKKYNWAPTTVKTILNRLVKKGFLHARLVGNSFLYTPTKTALNTLCQTADVLLENALDETTGPLLAHMLKNSDLSHEEIDMLRSILDDHKSKRKPSK